MFFFFAMIAVCAFVFAQMEIPIERDLSVRYNEILLELNSSNVSMSLLTELEEFLPQPKDYMRWSKPR